jgi:outer membrane murein-binding lipoprotein Lpp
MPRPLLVLIAVAFSLLVQSCGESPKTTIELTRQQLAEYKAEPTEAHRLQVESSLAKLDAQINQLELQNKTADAKIYRASEESLRADFRSARMVTSLRDAQDAVEGVGTAFKDAGRSIGDAFREVTGSADATPEP